MAEKIVSEQKNEELQSEQEVKLSEQEKASSYAFGQLAQAAALIGSYSTDPAVWRSLPENLKKGAVSLIGNSALLELMKQDGTGAGLLGSDAVSAAPETEAEGDDRINRITSPEPALRSRNA